MLKSLVITFVGPDRPGVVNRIADTAAGHGANWLDSHLANLAGQFSGIVLLSVEDSHWDALSKAMQALENDGLSVTITAASNAVSSSPARLLLLELTGLDHPGIVRDISDLLRQRDISISAFDSERFDGSMSGETMFRATAHISVPLDVTTDSLLEALESLSDSIMIDVSLADDLPAGQ